MVHHRVAALDKPRTDRTGRTTCFTSNAYCTTCCVVSHHSHILCDDIVASLDVNRIDHIATSPKNIAAWEQGAMSSPPLRSLRAPCAIGGSVICGASFGGKARELCTAFKLSSRNERLRVREAAALDINNI